MLARRVCASVLAIGLVWSGAARAHSLLDKPEPRDQQDGYKDGSACGVTRGETQPVTSYTAGQRATVQWLETVNHNGCFVVEFSAGSDQDFQVLGRKSHANPPAPASPSRSTPRSWSLEVSLPSTPCTSCTLRLRQIMVADDLTEDACPPANPPAGSTYTTCANISLGSGVAGTAAGGTTGGGGGGAPGGTGGGASASGGGSAAAAASAQDDGSCSFRLAPANRAGAGFAVLLLLAAATGRRRSRSVDRSA